MRKTLSYFIAVLIIVIFSASCRKHVIHGGIYTPIPDPDPVQIEETEPPVLTPVTLDISTNIKGFYTAVPARYTESQETYPLMIYFHGGGQYGNGALDLPKVLQEGVPKLLNEKKFPPSFTVNEKKYSFIIIAPQFVRMITNADVDSMIAYARRNYRIDTTRIYLSGFSLGARMLSNYAAAFPLKIAAITSRAGLPQIDTNFNRKCENMVRNNLPIWHVHNKDDSAWYYSEAVRYINTLNSFNPSIPPRFTTFEVGEARLHHDCWTRTDDPEYREEGKNIYEWMLQYTRP